MEEYATSYLLSTTAGGVDEGYHGNNTLPLLQLTQQVIMPTLLPEVAPLSMFTSKYDVDDRQPQFVFDWQGHTFGVTSFDPLFWLQSFVLVFMQTSINIVVALVVYHLILKYQHTTFAYLFGYGVICPTLLVIPWYTIRLLDLHNITYILLVGGATPSLLMLRCVEAMHGTLPKYATPCVETNERRLNFILYYATTLGFSFTFDEKTNEIVKVTKRDYARRILKFLRLFFFSIVCYSVLLPCQYKLFPSREINNILDVFYYGNLFNNFIVGATLLVCLDTGSTGLGLVASLLTGYSTTEMNNKPLIASESPSDFWGRRWNRIFASCLKSGVYLPARHGIFRCSRMTSSMLTFLVSGLFHEYILLIMSAGSIISSSSMSSTSKPQHFPNFGSQLLFFLWSGVVLMMEGQVRGKYPTVVQWITNNVAKPVRTFLVLMTALPILHWFTDEYVACGFFHDVSFGFPKVVYLPQQ